MKYWYILWITFCIPFKIYSQQASVPVMEREITVTINNEPLELALSTISKEGNFVFSYNPDAIDAKRKITLTVNHKSVRHTLNQLFNGHVTFKTKGKYVILQKNDNTELAKKEQVVEGYVYDSRSGRKLTETTVYDKDLLISAVTDKYGYFKLELPTDQPRSALHISKEGYVDTLLNPSKGKPNYVNIELSQKGEEVGELKPSVNAEGETKKRHWLPGWLIPSKVKINTRNLTDSVFRKVQFSFLPFISTNKLLTGNIVNDYSFNILAGYTQEVRKAEFGGVLNIVRYDAQYCQMAGVGNIVIGTARGLQAGGVFNAAGSADGVQMAGVFNTVLHNVKSVQLAGVGNITAGDVQGFQGAGILNTAKSMTGVQMSGVLNTVLHDVTSAQLAGIGNITGGDVHGLQAAGILNTAKTLYGVQIGGVVNAVLHDVKSVQVAGVLNIAGGEVEGTQVSGVVNYATKVKGYQISGVLNAALSVKGVQISPVNFADSCEGTPIGLFSFVKRGYHKIELSADEIFYTNAAFRTGVKRFHNIIQVGIRPDNLGNPLWTYGYGLGTTFGNPDKLLVDIDLIDQEILKGSDISYRNTLYKVYVGIDKRLTPKTSLSFGLTYNFFSSDTKATDYNKNYGDIIPYTLSSRTSTSGVNLKTWPGAKLSIRFL